MDQRLAQQHFRRGQDQGVSMSIPFFDGFDFYNSIDGSGVKKWDQGSHAQVVAGRFGGNAIRPNGSGNLFVNEWNGAFKTITPTNEVVVGFAMRVDGGSFEHPFLMFMDGNDVQCSLWIDPDTTTIIVRTARGTALTDSPLGDTGFVPPYTLWFYLEVKMQIGNPGGFEIRVNGTTVLTVGGVQTQQTGNSTVNRIALAGLNQFNNNFYVDDFFIVDTQDATGTVDFIGEVRVQTKYPDADGFQNDFLRSQGSVNATNVNTVPIGYVENGKYNYSGTVGAKDLYSIANFTVSGQIFAVQENISFRKDDVGNRNICPLLRTASTEFEGASVPCYSDYTWTGKVWEENPTTALPWTLTDLNLAEFGIKIKS